jgi:S1-C subfamily serine protease
MSNEMDMPFTYGEGIVANVLKDEEINQTLVIHTATILSGGSGSGLFNTDGRLVGLNIYAMRGLGGAVDLSNIKEFMR